MVFREETRAAAATAKVTTTTATTDTATTVVAAALRIFPAATAVAAVLCNASQIKRLTLTTDAAQARVRHL